MARGQSKAASNQLDKTNSVADAAGGKAGNIYSQLEPQFSQMASDPTHSPIYNTQMTNARQSLGGATAGITGQANLSAARTRNSAGIAPALDEAQRESGREQSQISTALPGMIQQQGLQGLGGLYGSQLGQQTDLLGLGPGTLQARAAGKSGDELAMDWIKTITGAGASAGSGGGKPNPP